jgi:hypothetical protein
MYIFSRLAIACFGCGPTRQFPALQDNHILLNDITMPLLCKIFFPTTCLLSGPGSRSYVNCKHTIYTNPSQYLLLTTRIKAQGETLECGELCAIFKHHSDSTFPGGHVFPRQLELICVMKRIASMHISNHTMHNTRSSITSELKPDSLSTGSPISL